MTLLIDLIYITREMAKLAFVIITSPFAFVGGLLLLASQYS
ncbi:hypothetical protein LCGC14_0978370 [marine sediment metagenome]|uniref:Uncharacterized protein n=1 Tax=marine sediment metagenome TaxID=412755 RepID=A0A0F9RG05_9ZZZZ